MPNAVDPSKKWMLNYDSPLAHYSPFQIHGTFKDDLEFKKKYKALRDLTKKDDGNLFKGKLTWEDRKEIERGLNSIVEQEYSCKKYFHYILAVIITLVFANCMLCIYDKYGITATAQLKTNTSILIQAFVPVIITVIILLLGRCFHNDTPMNAASAIKKYAVQLNKKYSKKGVSFKTVPSEEEHKLCLCINAAELIPNIEITYNETKEGEEIIVENEPVVIEMKQTQLKENPLTVMVHNVQQPKEKGFKKSKFELEDGSIYEGYHNAELEKSGFGILRYADGNCYEGEWRDDKKNGKGIMKYNNGDKYEGMFRDNLTHGKGVWKDLKGNVFDGMFSNDKIHGKGIFKYVSGDIYDGLYASGDVYVGDFCEGKREGKGVMTYHFSEKYDGEWRKDLRHGKCTYLFKNGDKYVGMYEDDVRQKGCMRFHNGAIDNNWDIYLVDSEKSISSSHEAAGSLSSKSLDDQDLTHLSRLRSASSVRMSSASDTEAEWDQLKIWLHNNRFPSSLFDTFKENYISMSVLPELGDEDYEKLGISIGHKLKLKSLIKNMKY